MNAKFPFYIFQNIAIDYFHVYIYSWWPLLDPLLL